MQTAVVAVAMWLIRLPDIGNQTVRSKPASRCYVGSGWGCATRAAVRARPAGRNDGISRLVR